MSAPSISQTLALVLHLKESWEDSHVKSQPEGWFYGFSYNSCFVHCPFNCRGSAALVIKLGWLMIVLDYFLKFSGCGMRGKPQALT